MRPSHLLAEVTPNLYAALGRELSAFKLAFLRTVGSPLGLPILPPLPTALIPEADPRGAVPQRVYTRGFTAGYCACRGVLGTRAEDAAGVSPGEVIDWMATVDLDASADALPPRLLDDWAGRDYPSDETWQPVFLGLVVALGEGALAGVEPPIRDPSQDEMPSFDGPFVVPARIAAISHLMGIDETSLRRLRDGGIDICWPDVEMQAESMGVDPAEFELERERIAERRALEAELEAYSPQAPTELLTALRDAGLAGAEVDGSTLRIDLGATQAVINVGEPSYRFGQWMLPLQARCVFPGPYSDDLQQLMQAFQPLASLCSWHYDPQAGASVAGLRWFAPVSFTTDDLRFVRDAVGVLTLEVTQRGAALGGARIEPGAPYSAWLGELRARIESASGPERGDRVADPARIAVAKLADRGWRASAGPRPGWWELRDSDAPLPIMLLASNPHPSYGAGLCVLTVLGRHPRSPDELIRIALGDHMPVAAFGSFTPDVQGPRRVAYGAFLPAGLVEVDRVERLAFEAMALATWTANNPGLTIES